MNRESEDQLLSFCAEQSRHFDPDAWARFAAVTAPEMAAVARFLAGVSWYGHQAELAAVAGAFSPEPFPALVRSTGFDPSRFAGRLGVRLQREAPPARAK